MSFPRYPKYKDSDISWIGEIPEHWSSLRLANVFQLQNRPVRNSDEIITAFRDGQVTLRSKRREEGFTNALKEIGYQGVRAGDLVIHAMDAFAGAVGVSEFDGKSTPVYSVCTPMEPRTSTRYYGLLVRHMALSGTSTHWLKEFESGQLTFDGQTRERCQYPFHPSKNKPQS